jgi:hypothetical protein
LDLFLYHDFTIVDTADFDNDTELTFADFLELIVFGRVLFGHWVGGVKGVVLNYNFFND